jgi:predicted RND superfamily exporter protein
MGALTTMISFAGLLLSFHPGLRSIGALAVVGIGTTLASALIFLPALLQWLEDRQTESATEAATTSADSAA